MIKNFLSNATRLALQEAIRSELYASALYKHLANQCQRLGYFGAAKYFLKESADELTHYQRLADYMNDRGDVAKIPTVAGPTDSIADLKAALLAGYNAEVDLGAKYAKWYTGIHPNDPLTAQFLLQYLEIQRTSIGEYGDWISRMNLAKDDPSAILLIDQELGED
jgi:ferritin